MEEHIHHSRKIGSCCRMYYYYEINVGVEVEGYLVLIFKKILSILKKNYFKEQYYNMIIKNSLPRKIIFCEVHNNLVHEHKVYMGWGECIDHLDYKHLRITSNFFLKMY